jgi:DNA repair exonuclease SbcCD ATPase subunit
MEGDQEEMERKAEEREKMMRKEQLRQMKRGMTGMERGLKQIRKMMENLSKKGIAVPPDAEALVNELQAALNTIKNATEFGDEVEAAMEVIQDKGSDLGEIGQKIGMLERLSQMTKQVSKEFAKIDKMVAKVKKSRAGREYAGALAQVEGQVSALKAEWESVRSAIAAGEEDGDDIRDTMESFFDRVGDIHRSLELVRQLGSISKMIKSAGKEIAFAEKEIARHRKAGKDVTRLDELLAAAKSKIAEVKSIAAQSGFDPEDLFSLMQELRNIGDEAQDELDRVSGRAETRELGASVIQALTWRRMGL